MFSQPWEDEDEPVEIGRHPQNKQSDNLSEQDLAKQRAGKEDKSSHDAKSRVKAGTGEGAGGGAKQKQNH